MYEGIPISIIAVGMGAPNADFFVREARECITGDMVIVRCVVCGLHVEIHNIYSSGSLGSCGGLLETLPVGSIVVPRASVSVTRNYDYDFTDTQASDQDAYRVSKPVRIPYLLSAAFL